MRAILFAVLLGFGIVGSAGAAGTQVITSGMNTGHSKPETGQRTMDSYSSNASDYGRKKINSVGCNGEHTPTSIVPWTGVALFLVKTP